MAPLVQFTPAAPPPQPEETLKSVSTRQMYRERQCRLQARDAHVNNTRIHRDYLRFLAATASSNFVMEKNLRYGDLRSLANVPMTQSPAWLATAYHDSPRALSMDATAWTHAEVNPWTTWKASWADRTTHPPPPSKDLNKRRWRDRFLRRHQPKPSSQEANSAKARIPPFVSAFRSAPPVKRPTISPPARKPTAQQGGFIEHLDENPRYQVMLKSDKAPRHVEEQQAKLKLKRISASQGHQNRAVLTKGEDGKRTTEVNVDEKESPDASKDDGGDESDKERRKRDIIKWALCFGSLPPKKVKKSRPGKAEAVDGGSETELPAGEREA
ncbi:hypothetical protein BU25DRAFT_253239 [Macroventuria anomochaeta]|uniref:Uncharacterized protein n=1 Tax=Macroventuria anomochaeta TaxID=301207 RepID=A0ACB6RGZ9_9PLEO|nr:uncharacterized protein BU25DRAFT_253239 [Macroventuria anomochaeta]KAF2621151.1 hypothetical protein BU25DRAFT_253239 [Macroventuria anomochaeta]